MRSFSRTTPRIGWDANRRWYEACKHELCAIFDPILTELRHLDPRIITPSARKGLSRINNNLLFHPDRPTYKDHFGLVFSFGKGLADFYVHLGVSETLVAGGLWHPSSEKLKKLRSEIDYEGARLMAVLESESFKSNFELFQEDRLKNPPRGYAKVHPYIELLKMKSLGASRSFERKHFLTGDFEQLVIDSYQAIIPMIDFINTAILEDEMI